MLKIILEAIKKFFVVPKEQKSEDEILLEGYIKGIDSEIQSQYNIWNNTTDTDLIEGCIYKIKGLQAQRINLYKELQSKQIV